MQESTLSEAKARKPALNGIGPTSDRQAAKLIRRTTGNRLTYTLNGIWRWWNGVYHEEIDERVLHALVETLTDSVMELPWIIDDSGTRRKPPGRAYAEKLEKPQNEQSLIKALQAECALPTDHWKDSEWTVLADGHCIDISASTKAGRLIVRPPDSSRPVTRAMNARWAPSERPEAWEQYLNRAVPSPALQHYLQEVVGCALLGITSYKHIPHLVGAKDSGKSTFLKVLAGSVSAVFGTYGAMVPAAAIMPGSQVFARDNFRGARLAWISEPDRNRIDDAFMLSITGGEVVQTEQKYKAAQQWTPECTLFIAANRVVRFDTRAEELLNRVDVVRFPNNFEPGSPERINGLDEMLATEHDGILNWIMEGAERVLQHDLVTVPSEIASERVAIADEASSARLWLSECLSDGRLALDVDAPASQCLGVTEAHGMYKCSEELGNQRALGFRQFSKDLEQRLGPHVKASTMRLNGIVKPMAYQRGDGPGAESSDTPRVSRAHINVTDAL